MLALKLSKTLSQPTGIGLNQLISTLIGLSQRSTEEYSQQEGRLNVLVWICLCQDPDWNIIKLLIKGLI